MLFSKFDVNRVEWLNLVFENRNQSYGAYELRRMSSHYLSKALLISIVFFSLLIIAPSAYYKFKDKPIIEIAKPLDNADIVYLTKIETPEKKIELPKAIEQKKSNVKQIDFSPPKVTRDDFVKTEAPTIDQITKSVIGNETIDGPESIEINASPVSSSGTTEGTGGLENNTTYTRGGVEIMPEFPGGMAAWSKFLSKNLQYPNRARDNGVSGRVVVSFIVEKNGEITALKIISGIGFGCDEEALRVIKKSPLWKPGFQNGKAVRVSYVIPIVFRLD